MTPSQKDRQRFLSLLDKYQSGSATPQEKAFVEHYLAYLEKQPDVLNQMPASEREALEAGMKEKLLTALNAPAQLPLHPAPGRSNAGWRYAAAAAAVIFLIGFYFLVLPGDWRGMPVTQGASTGKQNDLAAPTGNHALLTLADGLSIGLDSAKTGLLTSQGHTTVAKTAPNQVIYVGHAGTSAPLIFHTLTVPRGSQPVELTLADGSKAWLNVASSIRYPVAFTGYERRVEITGEVYFEVAKNQAMPFVVHKAASDVSVEVLGTHFNVNAYEDEPVLRTTLVEGSVRLTKGNTSRLLKPGQQGVVSGEGIQLRNADLAEALAWKNGLFHFTNADLETVLRQVSRWYNVKVAFEKRTGRHFTGKIPRGANASEVLKILSVAGDVQFKIEGQRIIVM